MKAFSNHGVCMYDLTSVYIFWCPGRSAPLPTRSSAGADRGRWERISDGQLSHVHWTCIPFLVGISKCRVRESYQMRSPLNTDCIFWYYKKKSSFNDFPIYFWGLQVWDNVFNFNTSLKALKFKALAAMFLNPYIFRFSRQREFPGVR